MTTMLVQFPGDTTSLSASADYPGRTPPGPSGEQITRTARLSSPPRDLLTETLIDDNAAKLVALARGASLKHLNRELRFADCAGMDPEIFHPDQGTPTQLTLARCANCPARLACLGLALRAEDPEARSGWYGGLSPADRDAVAETLSLRDKECGAASDAAIRAADLRRAGWTVSAIAAELGCCRRTVQRHLRTAEAVRSIAC